MPRRSAHSSASRQRGCAVAGDLDQQITVADHVCQDDRAYGEPLAPERTGEVTAAVEAITVAVGDGTLLAVEKSNPDVAGQELGLAGETGGEREQQANGRAAVVGADKRGLRRIPGYPGLGVEVREQNDPRRLRVGGGKVGQDIVEGADAKRGVILKRLNPCRRRARVGERPLQIDGGAARIRRTCRARTAGDKPGCLVECLCGVLTCERREDRGARGLLPAAAQEGPQQREVKDTEKPGGMPGLTAHRIRTIDHDPRAHGG